jgi:hypothetical protein
MSYIFAMILVAWLLGAALGASAHEIYPIKPVRATLRLEPDRIVADIQTDSIFWIEEIVGVHPMPAADWPSDVHKRVEDYVNAHLRLSDGGRALKGRLSEGRYRQFPWEINEEGSFFLRMIYPTPQGPELKGEADFYADYRREMLGELAGRPLPYADGYRVFLNIPGRKTSSYTLTPDAPSFAVSTGEARRSAWSMAKESFARGAETAASTAACFPLLLAAALCLGARPLGLSLAAALLAGGLAGGAAASAVNAPPWFAWAATLCAALAAGRVDRAAPRFVAGIGGAACLTFIWADGCKPLLPHSALAVAASLAGSLASGACLLAAVLFAVRAEHARLRTVSESRVEELFVSRLRLGGTTLAMIGAYGLWQSMQR